MDCCVWRSRRDSKGERICIIDAVLGSVVVFRSATAAEGSCPIRPKQASSLDAL